MQYSERIPYIKQILCTLSFISLPMKYSIGSPLFDVERRRKQIAFPIFEFPAKQVILWHQPCPTNPPKFDTCGHCHYKSCAGYLYDTYLKAYVKSVKPLNRNVDKIVSLSEWDPFWVGFLSNHKTCPWAIQYSSNSNHEEHSFLYINECNKYTHFKSEESNSGYSFNNSREHIFTSMPRSPTLVDQIKNDERKAVVYSLQENFTLHIFSKKGEVSLEWADNRLCVCGAISLFGDMLLLLLLL